MAVRVAPGPSPRLVTSGPKTSRLRAVRGPRGRVSSSLTSRIVRALCYRPRAERAAKSGETPALSRNCRPSVSRASQVACSGGVTNSALEEEWFGRQATVVRLFPTSDDRRMTMSRKRLAALGLGALALLAACGSDSKGAGSATTAPPPTTAAAATTTAAAATFPVTVNTPDGAVTIPAKPTQDRLDLADGHRDAVRHRRRPAGGGRRRPVELPGRRAEDRPVGLHPEPRGDPEVRPGPRRRRRHPATSSPACRPPRCR